MKQEGRKKDIKNKLLIKSFVGHIMLKKLTVFDNISISNYNVCNTFFYKNRPYHTIRNTRSSRT